MSYAAHNCDDFENDDTSDERSGAPKETFWSPLSGPPAEPPT